MKSLAILRLMQNQSQGDNIGYSNEDIGVDDDGDDDDDRGQDEGIEEKIVVPDTDEGLKDRFNHLRGRNSTSSLYL